MKRYLREAKLLDFGHPDIEELVGSYKWKGFSEFEKNGAIYNFVQNDTAYGYNESDEILALVVLKDGYGQCVLVNKTGHINLLNFHN